MDDSVTSVREWMATGQAVQTIEIDVPCEGIFFCSHPDVHVLSRIVSEGVNRVPVIPLKPMVRLRAGEAVGIVQSMRRKRKQKKASRREEVTVDGFAGAGEASDLP